MKPYLDEKNINILDVPAVIDVRGMKKYFSFNKHKTWKLIKTGEIDASKPGKEWKILSLSVWKYLKKHGLNIPDITQVKL